MSKREIFICIILVIIAIVRFCFFRPLPPDYGNAVGKSVSLSGIVTDAPDVRLKNQRITITPKNQESNILAVLSRDDEVAYGDEVNVEGTLETPENFTTNAGKEFNYQKYLANKDIYYIVNNANIKIISHGNGNILKSYLFRLRDSFMKNIGQVLLPPESDLADGLLLGARGGFDNNARNEFITTGTIHIIALSGYNVTIVAEGVMKVLGLFLAQTLSIIFGLLIIILFVIMSGASSTAIRAGIMAVIALTARLTGRNYDAGRALIIAALVMVAYDPRVLADISFQLSFLATGGLLFLTPKMMCFVPFLPMRFKIRELVATTLAATTAVLPILLYSTGILSLVSLPANILILPFIPLTMLLSFIAGMLVYISPIIALPFAFISHLLLAYIFMIIHFFASLPFASVIIQSFPLIITLALYALIIWWVFRKVDR